MATWVYACSNTTDAPTQSQTRNYAVAGTLSSQTEALQQMRLRGSYTASNLWLNCTAVSGTYTVRSRVNGANGNQVLSITTTGTKEDTTNTDSLVDGDLLNMQGIVSGSHGDSATVSAPGMLLADGGSNIPALAGQITALAAVIMDTGAFFWAPTGSPSANATETNRQVKLEAATTLSKFRTYLSSNSYTGSITIRTRVNTSNGGQSVSYATTVTGDKEDTSGTDTIAVGDLLAFGKDSGGTSGNGVLVFSQVKSACAASQPFAANSNAFSASADARFGLFGNIATSTATDAQTQHKAGVIDTWKNMQCNATANTRSDATTVDLRANAASPASGPAISVAAAGTGIKEDLTGSYTSAAADLLNYRVLAGGGTGSITLSTVGCQQGAGTSSATTTGAVGVALSAAKIASSLKAAAARAASAAAKIASSLKAAAAHVAAAPTERASSVKAAAAHVAASSAEQVLTNLKAAAAGIAASSTRIASSVKAASAGISASGFATNSAILSVAASVSARAAEIASSVKAAAAHLSAASTERVTANLVAVNARLQSAAALIANSVKAGSAGLSASAAERVTANLKAAAAHLQAAASEVASSLEHSTSGTGARATVVASSVKAGAGRIGASATVIPSGSAATTGSAGVGASAHAVASNVVSGSAGLGASASVVGTNPQPPPTPGGGGVNAGVYPPSIGGPGGTIGKPWHYGPPIVRDNDRRGRSWQERRAEEAREMRKRRDVEIALSLMLLGDDW